MAKNTERTNTPTEQNKEDNTLVLYRLTLLETAVKDVSHKMDTQDNIKRSDLVEFRDTIIARFVEIRDDLQADIKDLKKGKADQKDVDDMKTLIKSLGAILGTIISALIIFYLTTGRGQ